MKNVQRIDLGLTGYDELFMNDAERKENKLPRIYDVPISEIDDFPDHPFKVKVDEDKVNGRKSNATVAFCDEGEIPPVHFKEIIFFNILKQEIKNKKSFFVATLHRLPSRTSTDRNSALETAA